MPKKKRTAPGALRARGTTGSPGAQFGSSKNKALTEDASGYKSKKKRKRVRVKNPKLI